MFRVHVYTEHIHVVNKYKHYRYIELDFFLVQASSTVYTHLLYMYFTVCAHRCTHDRVET
jgi:hypothetical protein